jgi:ribonuclease-3
VAHEVLGEGAGRSKKEAEQAAAEQAWVELAARRDRAEAEARSDSDDEVDGVVEASAAGDLAD